MVDNKREKNVNSPPTKPLNPFPPKTRIKTRNFNDPDSNRSFPRSKPMDEVVGTRSPERKERERIKPTTPLTPVSGGVNRRRPERVKSVQRIDVSMEELQRIFRKREDKCVAEHSGVSEAKKGVRREESIQTRRTKIFRAVKEKVKAGRKIELSMEDLDTIFRKKEESGTENPGAPEWKEEAGKDEVNMKVERKRDPQDVREIES